MRGIIRVKLPKRRLSGSVSLPYSKSLSNRQLILGAHTGVPFSVEGLSAGDDTHFLVEALKEIGYVAARVGSEWRFFPPSKYPSSVQLYVGEGGTTLRFLLPLLARLPLSARVQAAPSLQRRPIQPLLQSLYEAGAKVRLAPHTYPIGIEGNPTWRPCAFRIDSAVSSQFLSALMLMAPGLDEGTVIYELAETPATKAYGEMTQQLLMRAGWTWQFTEVGWQLVAKSAPYSSYVFYGERDWSAAAVFFGLAALEAFEGVLPLSLDSLQPEARLFSALEWNYTLTPVAGGLRVAPKGVPLQGIEVDVRDYPDSALVLAVVAAMANSPSCLRGVHTLPYKETDRLQALVMELSKVGAHLAIKSDALVIQPAPRLPVEPPVFESYGDHRLAMALSLLAARCEMVTITHPRCVIKSFPGYWRELEGLGAQCREE
ncbi:MAG: hypothetical protein N3E49_02540 [Bacteroidia bacterium]|nr:hypothetical protein [Bacteroidia bacterium]